MQERKLNYRPTWDVMQQLNDNHEFVTANYFPINSAISMKDVTTTRQFTVCNDRAQSGSALNGGSIQLMQHRRIPADDHKGMDEFVDERDEFGRGIRVPASYWVQVFDSSVRPNNQRLVQLKSDEPARYFFNFDIHTTDTTPVVSTLSQDLKAAGIDGTVKIVTQPIAKNKILVRIENLHDLFDGEQSPKQVNKNFALALYKAANGDTNADFAFRELSLSANMDVQEMRDRKI